MTDAICMSREEINARIKRISDLFKVDGDAGLAAHLTFQQEMRERGVAPMTEPMKPHVTAT